MRLTRARMLVPMAILAPALGLAAAVWGFSYASERTLFLFGLVTVFGLLFGAVAAWILSRDPAVVDVTADGVRWGPKSIPAADVEFVDLRKDRVRGRRGPHYVWTLRLKIRDEVDDLELQLSQGPHPEPPPAAPALVEAVARTLGAPTTR